jgi:polysaccharide biosynthesis transport protein
MAESSSASSAASLQRFIRVVRRRFWLIALCMVLVPASVVAYSLAQEKQYRATASLLFGHSDLTALLSGEPAAPRSSQDERAAATNASLAALDVVAARTARRVGLQAGDVAARIDVEPVASADLLRISATDANPAVPAALANAYAQEFVALRRSAAAAELRRAENAVRKRLGEIQRRLGVLRDRADASTLRGRPAAERRALVHERDQLLQRAGDLRSGGPLAGGDVELVQRATAPHAPISPRPRRDAVIGLGLGLVLGLALALLFEMLDRRLRDPGEVGDLIELPIVGTIPNSQALADPASPFGLPDAEKRAFQMLRASLRYYGEARDLASVVVTSASPREGKTTVAWNLAAVSALTEQRVLLLEADLRQPSLAARLHVPAAPGVTDVLAGGAPLDAAVNEVVVGVHANGSTKPCTLDLVVAGDPRGDVSNLIESQRMGDLIAEAHERYDLVVIDTPPTSLVPDAIPLMGSVSGVLVVTRLGRTTRDAVRFLTSQLAHVGAPAVGVVVNSIAAQDGYYGRAYGEVKRASAPVAPGSGERVAGRR